VPRLPLQLRHYVRTNDDAVFRSARRARWGVGRRGGSGQRSGVQTEDSRGFALCVCTLAAQARKGDRYRVGGLSVKVQRGIEFGQDVPFEICERIGCGEGMHGDLEVCAHPVSQPLLRGTVEVSSVARDELELPHHASAASNEITEPRRDRDHGLSRGHRHSITGPLAHNNPDDEVERSSRRGQRSHSARRPCSLAAGYLELRISRHENASRRVRPGPGLRSGDPGQGPSLGERRRVGRFRRWASSP
jgi:hypothetical protein